MSQEIDDNTVALCWNKEKGFYLLVPEPDELR